MIKLYNPSEKKTTIEDTTYGNVYYDPERGVVPYFHSSTHPSENTFIPSSIVVFFSDGLYNLII